MATPKLRFKEFEGDWSTNKIEEISIVTSGGTPSRNVSDYWNGDIPWVTTSLVDFNVINEAEEFITQVGLDNSSAKLFHKDTILMAMYGQGITRGKVAILGIDATTNQACAAIKLKNGFETKFIFQNLMNRYEEIRDLSNEGGQKNLSAGIIKEILISFPEKEEQTKIASFLSAVDEKISQLTQKHELLSQYKQGMMQKLFSQQLRFKADDGSEFGEWENSYIGNECKITTGNKDTQNKVDDGLYPFFVRSQTVEKINSYSMDCEAILTSGDGVGVGKNYHYMNGKFDFHQRVYCLYEFSERLIGRYLYIYFSNYFYDRVKRLSAKNSVDSVRMDMISKMEIKLPCLEEQTKIANFLSAIDQKIEVVAQQIEQAKMWKKGLLQQMFV